MPSVRQLAPAAALLAAVVSADNCQKGSQEIGGNWYCQAVDTIQYANFGSAGSYNRITGMDSNSGSCSSSPFSYAGSLAPLNGEVSMHFRGPVALKQFAFYTPGSGNNKKSKRQHKNSRRGHGQAHAHLHKEAREVKEKAEEKVEGVAEKRGVGDWVHITMNGVAVSWINEWSGLPTDAAPAPAADPTPAAGAGGVVGAIASVVSNVAAQATNSPAGGHFTPSYDGDWVRAGYYDSASGTADGLTFLNHMGGQGSGVFDYVFGNSLSYAAPDAKSGSAGPNVLADGTLPSNTEIVIMTDKSCDDGTCDYSRPGTVAYHGFDGDHKVFVAELSMPLDGTTGFNADMPAWWLLNAQIPRTLQYGKQDCSCWDNGGHCGEFDIMEVLDSGNTRCKSTLHSGVSGGDSDYIERPTGAPIKVALVMSDFKTTIKVLPSSFDISRTLSQSQINDITGDNGTILGELASLFTLG